MLSMEVKVVELWNTTTFSQTYKKCKNFVHVSWKNSKFDSEVLINISRRILSAVHELSQSYENYKSGRSTS